MYAGMVNPDLILAGWDGSATAVTLRFDDNSNDDVLTVRDASGASILTGLGLIQLNGDYCGGTTLFTGSQMTLSGSTVTIVLGTVSGTPSAILRPRTWSGGRCRARPPSRGTRTRTSEPGTAQVSRFRGR